jgi:hypothetical protein
MIYCPNCGHRNEEKQYVQMGEWDHYGHDIICVSCGRHSHAYLFEFAVIKRDVGNGVSKATGSPST